METMNHECYVSFEIAKLLKEAGFDWKCRKCYNKGVLFDMEPDEIRTQTPQHSSYDVLAPTLDVAQRWLREVKNTHIEVSPDSTMSTYIYNILLSWDKFWLGSPISYSTYEEAQEAGIKKVLEIILEKVE